MFVAIKDLRFARGRFALMGSVIALITLLVVLLSGLTAGLGRANTSAITGLPADHLVFAKPPAGSSISFSASRIDPNTVTAWSTVPGVSAAEPLTVAMSHAESVPLSATQRQRPAASDSETPSPAAGTAASSAVAVFAVRPGSPLAPAPVGPGQVVLSTEAATALRATVGQHVTVAGRELTVSAIAGDDQFSHAAVVWTAPADATTAAGADPHVTAIALTTSGLSGSAIAAADARLHTDTVATADAVSAIGSYPAENGSLQLMRALLLLISALVVGAFFTVWTVQRSGDIAVLKALGSSTGYLLRDALGQALILLLAGTAAGTGLAAGLGAVAASAVPFVLDAATILVPAAAMVVLGLAGAAVSLRRVTSVDPLTALGSAR